MTHGHNFEFAYESKIIKEQSHPIKAESLSHSALERPMEDLNNFTKTIDPNIQN